MGDGMSSGLWSLFAGSFLAATLLPGGSELLYGALLLRGEDSPLALLAVATLGNTLGGLSSFAIGRWLRQRRPAGPFAARHEQALTRLRRFGAPALLASWVPVIGDPLCVAAGWLGIGWTAAALWIALGKAARYAALSVLLPSG